MSNFYEKFIVGFSVVLCTHNGKRRLHPTLAHLAAVHQPVGFSMELVLVDNASVDDTVHFVKEIWKDLGTPFPLQTIMENRPGKGYAIEAGYDAASYSYIVTVDDDNWLAPDYLLQAAKLFEQHPDIGILQGHNKGAFEKEPPSWIEADGLERFFVIGGPATDIGYFTKNDFSVWGAGMIILKEDWSYIRKLGFTFLTSKVPGKAAGEDNETAIALLLLGRKIYYSDALQYQHYMPAGRMKWQTLMNNFEVIGYTTYYFFLYALVLESYEKGYTLTEDVVRRKMIRSWLKNWRKFTWKQHLAYWVLPRKEYYQLRLKRYYSLPKWIWLLHKNVMKDITVLQGWMLPILRQNSRSFSMKADLFS